MHFHLEIQDVNALPRYDCILRWFESYINSMSYLLSSLSDCVNNAGPVTVTFGGVPATNVVVQGRGWIRGFIPSNPSGTCSVSVVVSFSGRQLTLPSSFCYLPPLNLNLS